MTTAAVGVAMMPLGAADAQTPVDWTGFYAGLHGGYLTSDVNITGDEAIDGTMSGFVGGGLAGYNFQLTPGGPFVFGVEGDIGAGHVSGNGGAAVDAVADAYVYEINWIGHIRLLAGVPHGPAMPFVGLGLAVADYNMTEDGTMPWDSMFTGVSLSGGVNAMFGPRLIGRAEVVYDIFGSRTYDDCTVDFNALTLRIAAILALP